MNAQDGHQSIKHPHFTLTQHCWSAVLPTDWIWNGRQASLSITNSQSLLKLMPIKSVMPSNHLSSPSPPAFNLSQHHCLFQWVSPSSGGQSIRASASVLLINICNWYLLGLTGLISLQSKGLSNASILQHSVFFMVQLSHPFTNYWKNHSFD